LPPMAPHQTRGERSDPGVEEINICVLLEHLTAGNHAPSLTPERSDWNDESKRRTQAVRLQGLSLDGMNRVRFALTVCQVCIDHYAGR
jgi:hypothetical protein